MADAHPTAVSLAARAWLRGHVWALDLAELDYRVPQALEHWARECRSLEEARPFARALGAVDLERDAGEEFGGRLHAGILRIPVLGFLSSRPSFSSAFFGGTAMSTLRAELARAVAAREVRGIVLDVDSPGGVVRGARETFQAVRAADQVKPVWAVANGLMASAAYWVSAGARRILASPSADVGSIGVFGVHEDRSVAYAAEGVTHTIISAGEFKAEDLDIRPLTDDARARLQRRIDATYADFIADVATGRRTTTETVREGYGRGAVVGAVDAQAAGLVDEIATLEHAIGRFATVLEDARRRADLLALRH